MQSFVNRIVGRSLFRIVRRWPIVFAGMAVIGECVGVVALTLFQTPEWWLGFVGIGAIVFYTGLLVLLAVKLKRGTWVEFCDWGESLFLPDVSPVMVNTYWADAAVGELFCPQCRHALNNERPAHRTLTQILRGGWTCPYCASDIDRHGDLR